MERSAIFSMEPERPSAGWRTRTFRIAYTLTILYLLSLLLYENSRPDPIAARIPSASLPGHPGGPR